MSLVSQRVINVCRIDIWPLLSWYGVCILDDKVGLSPQTVWLLDKPSMITAFYSHLEAMFWVVPCSKRGRCWETEWETVRLNGLLKGSFSGPPTLVQLQLAILAWMMAHCLHLCLSIHSHLYYNLEHLLQSVPNSHMTLFVPHMSLLLLPSFLHFAWALPHPPLLLNKPFKDKICMVPEVQLTEYQTVTEPSAARAETRTCGSPAHMHYNWTNLPLCEMCDDWLQVPAYLREPMQPPHRKTLVTRNPLALRQRCEWPIHPSAVGPHVLNLVLSSYLSRSIQSVMIVRTIILRYTQAQHNILLKYPFALLGVFLFTAYKSI